MLGTFKEGGEVPETGKYKLHEGERVLSVEEKEKLESALKDALAALAGETSADPDLHEMRIRKDSSGERFIVEHHFGAPERKMEEHTNEGKDLAKHVNSHWGITAENEPEDKGEGSKEEDADLND